MSVNNVYRRVESWRKASKTQGAKASGSKASGLSISGLADIQKAANALARECELKLSEICFLV